MAPIYKASEIANYFLLMAQKDGELISNLKVQKLVYYAQGVHLALYGTPIFKEQIKAWNLGPVIPALYFYYHEYEARGIPPDKEFKETQIDKETRSFLNEIYTAFGQFSAKRLVDFTHSDKCWKDAHPNGIISHKAMHAYSDAFRPLIPIDSSRLFRSIPATPQGDLRAALDN